MFAEFELFMGKLAAEGKTLTADVLCAEYRRLNEMYYGPDMVVDDEIAMEWARIPHFYYNYYVFQYATGYSAAIALSRRILREGESAVKDYLGFLSGGCSVSSGPAPWGRCGYGERGAGEPGHRPVRLPAGRNGSTGGGINGGYFPCPPSTPSP